MVITIDGPAGTGKSSVAQGAARRLDFDFLDTGAMYRAVGLAALRQGVDLKDGPKLEAIARQSRLEFDFSKSPPEISLNDQPVEALLRSAEVTRAASFVAQAPGVRKVLVDQQREIGRSRKNIVTEGRDQGTIVFPDAELKFYLDATPAERAKRRGDQIRASGQAVDLSKLQRQITERDERDSRRAVGPLAIPKDARVIDSTSLTEDQVIEKIVEAAKQLQKA